MKIDVLCNDGSPLGVTSKTLWGDNWRVGLGGAEYALVTMCEEWIKAGHSVVLYNDPMEFAASPFEQRNIANFVAQEERDVLIIFRSPNTRIHTAKGLKVWWSCDQYTVDDFAHFSRKVDRIVCISDYHVQYFKNVYGIHNAIHIDLPIRLADFEPLKDRIGRVYNKLLFTSIPDRGLKNLFRIYPKIQRELPDVSLTITSDYRLWGAEAGNHQHRVDWMLAKNVNFLGAVHRGRLLEEQLSADILLYPGNYEELFCIAVAEAQCCGAYPVTSNMGALATTNMGTIVYGDANRPSTDDSYVETVVELLSDRKKLELRRAKNKVEAKLRFAPENVLAQWNERVFT